MEGHLFGMISILLKINRGELFLPKAFLNGYKCFFIRPTPKISNENLKFKKKSQSQAMAENSDSNVMIEYVSLSMR